MAESSPLYDSLRDPAHQPPTVIDYDLKQSSSSSSSASSSSSSDDSDKETIDDNLKTMYRQMIINGANAELFMGKPLQGTTPNPGAGSLENVPHNIVHKWTGEPDKPYEDMGVLSAAARDPVFYCHHSNVDRLWNVWTKTLGGKNFTDPQFLNHPFFFFDENRKLVKVTIQDSLNTDLMGYTYENVKNEWLKAKPSRAITVKVSKLTAEPSFPLTLEKEKVSATVKRPPKAERKGDEVEVLAVDGIEYDIRVFTKFDVFVNAPSADTLSVAAAECAGSFVNVPHFSSKGMNKMKTCKQFALSGLLEDIGAADDDSVVVTLVPRAGTVTVAGLSIALLA